MGVRNCSRMNCQRILCDRYSDTFGYVCDNCFEELVEMGPLSNIDHLMGHQQKNGLPEKVSRDYFSKIFKEF